MLGLFPQLGMDIARLIVNYLEPREQAQLLQTCKPKGNNFVFSQNVNKFEQEALHTSVAMVTDPLSDTVAPLNHYFVYPTVDTFSTLVNTINILTGNQTIVTEDARRFFYNFSFYMIDRLLWNSLRFTLFKPRHHKPLIHRLCSSRDVQNAVRWTLNGELIKDAMHAGTKSVRCCLTFFIVRLQLLIRCNVSVTL
jgi:hypothetical protein